MTKTIPTLLLLITILILPISKQLKADDFSKALQATIHNHPEIKAKLEEIHAHESAVSSSQAAYYPSLSAQINNMDDNYQQGLLKLQQPIYTFGKTSNAIDLAKSKLNSQQLSLIVLKRQLLEQTALIYAQKIGVLKQIDIAKTNVEEHQQLLNHINRRQQGKLAATVDVSLGESRLIMAASQLEKLNANLDNINTELRSITGSTKNFLAPIPLESIELTDMNSLIQKALSNSASIAHQYALIEESKINIENKKISLYPNLMLRAERDFLDDSITGDNTRIGISLEASFESMGLVAHHQTNEQAANHANNLMKLEVLKQDTVKQMTNWQNSRLLNQKQIQTHDKAITIVNKIMESYIRLYKSGRKSLIDVLNIQRELTELRIQKHNAQTQWLIDSLHIAALIGQLDQFTGLGTDSSTEK
ncbi:MAG: TolC family protein [Gammaproteobacteria bacterium]|nr:TolC family protein [Gammaproteobacteria bacterium]